MNKTDITRSTTSAIDAFLEKHEAFERSRSRARLIFALDATASRQPTWDKACALTADMFREAISVGGLEVQLVYYRGALGKCMAGKWKTDSKDLSETMSKIECQGGYTQIEKVLHHARCENEKNRVAALCFIGDSAEEEPDALCGAAGLLRNVPCFMFQEGNKAKVEKIFREIARITAGVYARFDTGSADQLRDLLKAVGAFAAGGRAALEGKPGATLLLQQLPSRS
jgi:hypothetical protein